MVNDCDVLTGDHHTYIGQQSATDICWLMTSGQSSRDHGDQRHLCGHIEICDNNLQQMYPLNTQVSQSRVTAHVMFLTATVRVFDSFPW